MAKKVNQKQDKKAAIALIVLAIVGYGGYSAGSAMLGKFQALPVKGSERPSQQITDTRELKELYPVIAESERVKERLDGQAVEAAFRLPPPIPKPDPREAARLKKEAEDEEAARLEAAKKESEPSVMEQLANVLWIEAMADRGIFLMGRFWEKGESISVPGLPFKPVLVRVSSKGAVLAHDEETVFLPWGGG